MKCSRLFQLNQLVKNLLVEDGEYSGRQDDSSAPKSRTDQIRNVQEEETRRQRSASASVAANLQNLKKKTQISQEILFFLKISMFYLNQNDQHSQYDCEGTQTLKRHSSASSDHQLLAPQLILKFDQ